MLGRHRAILGRFSTKFVATLAFTALLSSGCGHVASSTSESDAAPSATQPRLAFSVSGPAASGRPTPIARVGRTSEAMYRATVLIEASQGHGGGVLIGEGLVATAHHVVEGGAVAVRFTGGERREGAVVYADPGLDFALVSVNAPSAYPVMELACGAPDREVELVVVGHPLEARWIPRFGRFTGWEGDAESPLLAIDATLGLGVSGGPVFDKNERVAGLATAILVEPKHLRAQARAGHPLREAMTGQGLVLPAQEFCGAVAATRIAAG